MHGFDPIECMVSIQSNACIRVQKKQQAGLYARKEADLDKQLCRHRSQYRAREMNQQQTTREDREEFSSLFAAAEMVQNWIAGDMPGTGERQKKQGAWSVDSWIQF
jgi:hypothetical protein